MTTIGGNTNYNNLNKNVEDILNNNSGGYTYYTQNGSSGDLDRKIDNVIKDLLNQPEMREYIKKSVIGGTGTTSTTLQKGDKTGEINQALVQLIQQQQANTTTIPQSRVIRVIESPSSDIYSEVAAPVYYSTTTAATTPGRVIYSPTTPGRSRIYAPNVTNSTLLAGRSYVYDPAFSTSAYNYGGTTTPYYSYYPSRSRYYSDYSDSSRYYGKYGRKGRYYDYDYDYYDGDYYDRGYYGTGDYYDRGYYGSGDYYDRGYYGTGYGGYLKDYYDGDYGSYTGSALRRKSRRRR